MRKYLHFFVTFVELRTKAASVLPFTFAVVFYLFHYAKINGILPLNFILFFLAMLLLDMATTAINHIYGFTKETSLSMYDQALLNQMADLNISISKAKKMIIVMLSLAALTGLLLVFLSNMGVLLLGMLCFLIGISYSYGKHPIAATCFGELFAGGTMGIILPVIVLFTQYKWIPFELNPMLIIAFFPFAFFIANILFANNLCDLKKDRENKRFTLAHYVTTKQAIAMLKLSQLGAFCFSLLAIYLKFLPIIFLVTLLFIPFFTKRVDTFALKMIKPISFPIIVKNFILFSQIYIILMFISLFL